MLEDAKRVDAEEDLLFGPDGRGDELPQGLGRRAERLRPLQETKASSEEEYARAAQEDLMQPAQNVGILLEMAGDQGYYPTFPGRLV